MASKDGRHNCVNACDGRAIIFAVEPNPRLVQSLLHSNVGSNGVQKTSKTAEKLKNRLFHKNRFFDNFKLNMGGLGVSGGMAWTVRTDSLELWRDLVLHGMGEVDFHV